MNLNNEEPMITVKKKVCKGCGQEAYIWARGMCKRCSVLATKQGEHRTFSSKRYKNIPSRKKQQNRTDIYLKSLFGFRSQVELFDYLWDNRPWECPFTGENLKKYADDSLMRRICCAHVLPKGKFPLFKLNPDNVMLVDPRFHNIVDRGTSQDRDNHPSWNFAMWDELVEGMKEEYKIFKQQHML